MDEKSGDTRRIVGLDLLRICACLMVILLHTSAQNWYITPIDTADWRAMHIWNTATRAAVPIFFMISGALFLSAGTPTKRLWRRNIPHLLVVYVLWSMLYGIDNMTLGGFIANPAGLLGEAIVGKYHLWFLPMMIGIYLILPALYAIAHYDGGRMLTPTMVVFLLFGILSGTISSLSPILPWSVTQLATRIVPDLCGFCGYFLLGYVLIRGDFSWIPTWVLGVIFAGCVALVSIAGIAYSGATGTPTALLHESHTLPTAVESVCLFLLFLRVRISSDTHLNRAMKWLSGCTLGVYLLHPFVLEQLLKYGFSTAILPAWAGVPLVLAVVAVICFAITALLRQIPFLRNWIV